MESNTVGAEDSEYFFMFWQKGGGKEKYSKASIWKLLWDYSQLSEMQLKEQYDICWQAKGI